jgi:hypothetical protein
VLLAAWKEIVHSLNERTATCLAHRSRLAIACRTQRREYSLPAAQHLARSLKVQATGFFWVRDGALFLITNWHNVTGWDPTQDKALSGMAFTPNVVSVDLAYRAEREGREALVWQSVWVELFDQQGKPLWLEHPTYGRRVDVVAVEVGTIGNASLWTEPINTYADFIDFEPGVGDDAFVLGYPLGLTGGSRFPIWKRASIASEPGFDLDELPKLLIDTATRKGMSGSPVIAVRRGVTQPRGTSDFDDSVFGTSETFLGVYSGRVDDDPLGAQIGIVWKAEMVAQIIDAGVAGTDPFSQREG